MEIQSFPIRKALSEASISNISLINTTKAWYALKRPVKAGRVFSFSKTAVIPLPHFHYSAKAARDKAMKIKQRSLR